NGSNARDKLCPCARRTSCPRRGEPARMPAMPTIRQSLLQDALDGQLDLVGLTVDQYHDFIDNGTIPEDPSMELLDGLLVRKDRSATGEDPMTIGDRHRMAVMRLERLLPKFEPFGSFLQCQQPIVLPPRNEPEPDISIIRGDLDKFERRKPRATDVILVLEVADNSLRRDLGLKLRIYARANI